MRTSNTNTLENAQAERNLYYYGARYLDPSDAMWLSVDPLWEKYVGMTTYQYCAGYIALIEENEDEKDTIYAGASIKNGEVVRDKEGKVKGLEYDKDKKIDKTKNKSIEVSKGVLSKPKSYADGEVYIFKSGEESKQIFEFMAKNTNVEWSYFGTCVKGKNEDYRTYYLATSHDKYQEQSGATCAKLYIEGNVPVEFHNHSHPVDYSVDEKTNASPSDYDLNFAKYMLEVGSKFGCIPSFSIYSRKLYPGKSTERAYYEYKPSN